MGTGLLEGYLSVRAFESSQRRVETLEAQVIEKQRILREVAYSFAGERYREKLAEEARLLFERQLREAGEKEQKRLEERARQLRQERERILEEIRQAEEIRKEELRQEALRQEALRQEAQRQEALRRAEEQRLAEEAARIAAEEAARLSAEEAEQQPLDLQDGAGDLSPAPSARPKPSDNLSRSREPDR